MFKFENARNFVRKNVPPLDEFDSVFDAESPQLESKFRLVENEDGYQELFLLSNKGEEFRLNDYLPEGVKFKGGPGKKFSYGSQGVQNLDGELNTSNEVRFDSEKIDTVQGRLGLFHEIGHAIDFVENDGNKGVESRYMIRKIKGAILNSPGFMWMDESEEKQKFFLTEFRERWRNIAKEYAETDGLRFRYKDLIDALKEFVRVERDAWSNGLRLYRKIKSERETDILEGAETSEIFDSVNRALASYERGYGSILDDYNSKGPIRRFVEGHLG